ncbi:MAG TPA: hypothetical protein VGO78_04720, partial [Acidimicrobiales bacterium]|nr:hypothetical protein [Acidimicrobiales bacterium]
TSEIETVAGEQVPLLIGEATFTDPTLVLGGDGWSLAATCPWRVVDHDHGIEMSWSSSDAEDRVWDLVGVQITAVRQHGSDPAFDLSTGRVLEVFSDTDLDPWVLRLAGMTFVGPLRPT